MAALLSPVRCTHPAVVGHRVSREAREALHSCIGGGSRWHKCGPTLRRRGTYRAEVNVTAAKVRELFKGHELSRKRKQV